MGHEGDATVHAKLDYLSKGFDLAVSCCCSRRRPSGCSAVGGGQGKKAFQCNHDQRHQRSCSPSAPSYNTTHWRHTLVSTHKDEEKKINIGESQALISYLFSVLEWLIDVSQSPDSD